MDIEQLEGLALGDDRSAALAALVAGTEEHDYWRAIHLQHAGELDEVDAMLDRWRARHGDTTSRARLDRRQLLLRAGVDLAAAADRLRDEAGAVLHHEPEIEAAAARHPTRFEDGGLDEDKLLQLALGRGRGLDEITPAGLVRLVGVPMDAHRTRLLLERLDRTGLPGLVALIAADLAEKSSKGFGSVAIHHRLTRAELDELARARPELRQHKAWVEAVVTRMRPPSHVDWDLDLGARVAYLDELWAEVDGLPPSFNSLKAHVLYHRLGCDLRAGTFDQGRLLVYLALPRRGSYVRASWLEKLEHGIVAALDHDFSRVTGLPTVVGDEPIVRRYLAHFLRDGDDRGADFGKHVEGRWLDQLRAETRLLAGDRDVDRWTSVLGASNAMTLRDRVELDFAPTNPRRFGREARVALDVDIKNAGTLRVKVFRIDVAAHFQARGADVDTTLDLDGLAAGWEELRPWTAPALQRVRTRFELDACERAGTYVVELIAGGKASRALVRKGDLRYTTRPSAAGVALTVLDERGQPCPTATVWMGGREYRPRDDGDITLPFSTRGSGVPILLVDGDLAVVTSVQLPGESYELDTAILLDRQSVVPGREATALVRASVTVAGVPTTVALLEEPYAEVTVADRAGVPATRRQPLELRDDGESELTIAVPENAASLAITVGARARMVSEQRTVDLVDETSLQIGAMHAAMATESLYLVRDEGGFALAFLGKSGEPRAGRAVSLQLRLRAVTFLWEVTLATDERGRIALGAMAGVTSIHAMTTTGLSMTFAVAPPVPVCPPLITAREGDEVIVPVASTPGDWTVTELRGGAVAHDHARLGRMEPGVLRVAGLPAGDHVIAVRGQQGVRVSVTPAPAPIARGWASLPATLVELRPPVAALGAVTAGPESLDITVLGATRQTRVHVIATPLWTAPAWSADLATAMRSPQVRRHPPAESHYVSGRDIGDEYRYVLDRQHAARRAGLLLDRPSVLLNPWALRTTSTSVQTAAGGGAWAGSPPRPGPMAGAPAPRSRAEEQAARVAMDDAYASYDFLGAPPVVLANLRPDSAGRVRVPRASLGDATLVRVVCVDPTSASARLVSLAPRALPVRDLRLASALPAEHHLREDRRLQGLAAGATLNVADRATTRVELVDTVDKLYRALCAISGDDDLATWSFLPMWSTLSREEKLTHYSKHACHELALFIYFKDRPLFDDALRPYLASKLHKTFVDHWLLGDELRPYLASWRFARLNALERALLARRMPEVKEEIARSLADAVDLIPPDPEGDDRLVDAFLAGGKLSGDATVMAEVGEAAPMEDKASYQAADMLMSLDAGEGEGSEELERESKRDRAPKAKRAMRPQAPPPPAPAAPAAAMAGPTGASFGYAGGDFDATRLRADLEAREIAAPLYRGADKTQEWAEHNWWHTRVEDADRDHIPVAKLWRDLAAHGDGPFLSPHVAGIGDGFAALVAALAVIDLPFAASPHAIVARGAGATVTPGSNALAAVAALDDIAGPPLAQVLVGQSYFRADDRWEWDGAEQREKYVTGELLVAVIYQCQVVVTNPTSRVQRLAVLVQTPAGSMPVNGGIATRTHRVELSPYATSSIEYAFYFPAAGTFAHYGAQVTRSDELVAAVAARELTVVREPTTVDTTSWSHVSQRGTLDEVVAFLATQNLGRIDLSRAAWRMKERAAFERIVAALSARHVHDETLWAYALVHGDRARVAEWLAHQQDFLALAGPDLDAGLAPLEPVARGLYQHLEYAPLVNARAHRLGERRTVLNDGLAAQWHAFLERVATRRAPGHDDWLAAAHYLFTMDRPDDGVRALGHAGDGAAALQHAYLAAYAAAARGDLAAARANAAPHAGHAVDRWRHRFAALVAMLDEVEGRTTGDAQDVGARDHRDRTMDRLAAQQPSLAIAVDNGEVVLTHVHAARAQVRFYRMDVELLFSRQPFLSAATDRFSFISPGASRDVELSAGGRTTVRIPDEMARANLVIDAVSGPLRATVTHFANDLAVAVMAPYGQLQVRQSSTAKALSATYVKTYARMRGGGVQFFKDGYTDLRGRFDYATLSTSDLDNVERFALLVLHDSAGASVLETEPPTR